MNSHSGAFHAGAASIDITPAQPLPLAGYDNRPDAATQVADSLEANAVVVRRNETFVVFVGCDLLFIGHALRRRLETLLADCVPAERLFVSATHTHFAPATDAAMPRLGRVSPAYVETVASAISSMVRSLMRAPLTEAILQYRVGSGDHAIHRRLPVTGPRIGFPPWGRRWEMRPNKDVVVDRRIRVVSIEDARGNLNAVCWSYACHPVCYPDKSHVSADFPGVVRRAIRARFGNVPVIYWQGFAGDVRPKSIAASSLPAFGSFTAEQWREWSGGLAECVIDAMQVSGQQLTGSIGVARRQLLLSDLGLRPEGRDISVHEVQLGDKLEVFGLSAEPVNAYVGKLEAARPRSTVIPVGCIDGVPCYLPTDEMVGQGGYEVTGFRRLFGVSGRFRSGVTALIEREFRGGPV